MVDRQNRISSGEDDIKTNRQKIWDSVSINYEMVQGAQLSNSFVILMSLLQSEQPLTTTQISETISKRSKGRIYKNPATLKDALDKRLIREGYVDGITIANKILYSITSKGRKLLKGWIGFLVQPIHKVSQHMLSLCLFYATLLRWR